MALAISFTVQLLAGCRITHWLQRQRRRDTFITQEIITSKYFLQDEFLLSTPTVNKHTISASIISAGNENAGYLILFFHLVLGYKAQTTRPV